MQWYESQNKALPEDLQLAIGGGGNGSDWPSFEKWIACSDFVVLPVFARQDGSLELDALGQRRTRSMLPAIEKELNASFVHKEIVGKQLDSFRVAIYGH